MSPGCGTTADVEADATGFVLTGGRSSRMGSDKALVQLAGSPLVGHAIGILKEAGLRVCLAGGQSVLSVYAPIVEDRRPGLGPLSGVCAALGSSAVEWHVFLPVDMPLMPASLLICMLRDARFTGSAVTLVAMNGCPQPFPAVVRRAALPCLERELASGKLGCLAGFRAAAIGMGEALRSIPIEMLVQARLVTHPAGYPAARWFLNVNTQSDLERVEVHMKPVIA